MKADRRVLGADNGITGYRIGSVEVYITIRSQANRLSPIRRKKSAIIVHTYMHTFFNMALNKLQEETSELTISLQSGSGIGVWNVLGSIIQICK